MKHHNVYLYVIALIFVVEFCWSQYLSFRNRRLMSPTIPTKLKGIYNEEGYAKQQEYQKANSHFSLYSGIFWFVVIFVFLMLGGFGWLDQWLREYISNEIWLGLAFFGILMVASELISVPFSYYATFVIEEHFGFNKTTKQTFWVDSLKSLLLSIVLGGVILYLVIWLYNIIGDQAWLAAWGTLVGFILLFTMFYSNIIVPLYNKQTPLEEGELRESIEGFAKKAGFEIKNIFVMDASKRSSKANAYFTGIGAKKRIVLYDTLINELTIDEIVAVLAHEIGHYKKKHTLQNIATAIFTTGGMLFLLSLLIESSVLAEALGAKQASFHIGLVAFAVLSTPVFVLLSLFTNKLSRINEYQADAFAAQYNLGEALISALKKMSVKALSNLNPDPLFVSVHYSHPTLLQRIEALDNKRKR